MTSRLVVKVKTKAEWSIGIKLCWLINEAGKGVAWEHDGMNVSDKSFNLLLEPLKNRKTVLADYGEGVENFGSPAV